MKTPGRPRSGFCGQVDAKQTEQKKGKLDLSNSDALAWLIYGIVLYGASTTPTGRSGFRAPSRS